MEQQVERVVTARLDLRPVIAADVDGLYAITSDPVTWEHASGTRHTDPRTTQDWISRAHARWTSDGLSYWLVRLRDGADVIGIGGVQRQPIPGWNLYYRFAPRAWGHGYATELGHAALEAAHDVDNSVPVIAWILPHNTASLRVAGRLGLIDHGLHTDPSDGQPRLAYADRHVTDFD